MSSRCSCGGTGIYKVISDERQVITCDTCGHAVESAKDVPVWVGWVLSMVEKIDL